ncbi:MAG: tRNA (adenosine(37)-N6)-threonylcarbamoyltransferase complex dimerization subunit type 1 TsaB [Candidatus Delongbacteria bacterium]|nr:tRNA (adenosine(37)-N6)-threonylcarbamoyltransferase complex dimerization subunit type 1 TsaB [Candidatus Delongbacteria bacterium]MBN2834536.1 tRNA (adenosine(37)-N6)-threonylcarbamoyltransferase complex dimerization subunit type 1 TsaB [Candidatus Delongbacteria bacterium]
MKILSLESSGHFSSISLFEDEKCMDFIENRDKHAHNGALSSMINNCFNNNSVKASQIDLYVIDGGPGSFTGLRIGASLLKSLSFSVDKPFISLNSTEIIAYKLMKQKKLASGIIRVLYDGRQKDHFTADYRIENNEIIQIGDIIVEPYGNESIEAVDYICGVTESPTKPDSFLEIEPTADFMGELARIKFKGISEKDDYQPHYYKEFSFRK